MTETDINEALINLNNKLLGWYNECFPLKTKIISSRDQNKPQINHSIKNNITKWQKKYILYKYGLISERECKYFRTFVKNQIRTAKKKY